MTSKDQHKTLIKWLYGTREIERNRTTQTRLRAKRRIKYVEDNILTHDHVEKEQKMNSF